MQLGGDTATCDPMTLMLKSPPSSAESAGRLMSQQLLRSIGARSPDFGPWHLVHTQDQSEFSYRAF